MHSNKPKLLKIPFISKSKMMNIVGLRSGKYLFEGIAYYLVDSRNKIIWERAKLTKLESFRPNDPKMKETDFWKSKGKYRISIFPESNISYQIVKNNDSKILDYLNDWSIKYSSTVLSLEGMVSGSNSSGADKNPFASPIIISSKISENFRFKRFVNSIKTIREKDKYWNKIICKWEQLDQFEEMTLEELLNNSLVFSNNFHLINLDKSEWNNNEIKLIRENTKTINEEKQLDLLLIKNKLVQEDKIILKHRQLFKILLNIEAHKNGWGEFQGLSIDLDNTEACHIIPVKEIKKQGIEKNLLMISDPNNGLLLDPTTHTLMDKGYFRYDEDGKVIKIKEFKGNVNNLLKDVLTIERKNYLKMLKK